MAEVITCMEQLPAETDTGHAGQHLHEASVPQLVFSCAQAVCLDHRLIVPSMHKSEHYQNTMKQV